MDHNHKNCCNVGLTVAGVSSSKLQDLKDDELSNVAERIIQNINAAFERVGSLDEFDIIPQESQSNRSPVINVDTKLALESWCVAFVYVHSLRHFQCLTQKTGKNGRRSSLASLTAKEMFTGPGNEYFDGKNRISYSQLSESERVQRALTLNRILVLLNPDLSLAWNFRKEAFRQGHSSLKDELDLITLTASRKPKCPEGFSYRRWLMQDCVNNGKFNTSQSMELFQSEAVAVEKAAIRYFSNYHAWQYRHFLLELFLQSANVPDDQKLAILKYEREISDDWLNTHVSDNSGFHYRQKLLEQVITTKGRSTPGAIKTLRDELEKNDEMISYYPGHECLWYHRRAVLKYLLDSLSIPYIENTETNLSVVKAETMENEIDFLHRLSESQIKNGRDEKGIEKDGNQERNHQLACVSQEYLSLNILYSERYSKWLKYSYSV